MFTRILILAAALAVSSTFALAQTAPQPAAQPAAADKKLQPNAESAAYNREVAKSLRRKHTYAMDVARNNAEPLKSAATEHAKFLEDMIVAVEELANADEQGDPDRVAKANKDYWALQAKSAGYQERTNAAREQLTLINNNAITEMKKNAGPLEQAQIEQYGSIRQRAIEAWANVRTLSQANPDGLNVASAKIQATRLTLSTNRYERVVKLKLKASQVRAKAEKSDTPDLFNQVANSLDQVAADLAKNLDEQIELKTRELELNLKQDNLESQAQSLLR